MDPISLSAYGFCQGLELARADFYQGEFGRDKEAIGGYERDDAQGPQCDADSTL